MAILVANVAFYRRQQQCRTSKTPTPPHFACCTPHITSENTHELTRKSRCRQLAKNHRAGKRTHWQRCALHRVDLAKTSTSERRENLPRIPKTRIARREASASTMHDKQRSSPEDFAREKGSRRPQRGERSHCVTQEGARVVGPVLLGKWGYLVIVCIPINSNYT